jgi:hypothetical protein
MGAVRVGIFDHFGWAVAVTATADGRVVDRRRIELIEPGLTQAPIHYEAHAHHDEALAELVAGVRAAASRATAEALAELEGSLTAPVVSMSLRRWPPDFPDDITVLRRAPYESRADAIMYRQVLADIGRQRGWDVRQYDARAVLTLVAERLGDQAEDVLNGPRRTLGPPWTKDHRVALAAAMVSG